MKKYAFSVLLALAASLATAQIRFYRQLPELALSPHYKVEVRQGTAAYQEIFTYQITPNQTGHVTKNDQFANFGFNPVAGPVQIKVSRKDGVALNSGNASLKNKTYTDVSSRYEGGALVLECPSSKKHLYVSFAGKTEYPLLIFVDPFSDSPIPAGAKVVTFAARNQAYVQTAQYDRYTVPNDVDVVVIEDGALIKGTVHTASGRTKPLLLTGRGVILGNGEVLHGSANIPFNALVITKGQNHLVENIMVINSRHFGIDIGDKCTLDNAKIYGYDANNDGIVGGDDAIIRNTFTKVNDDHIKLYNNRMKVSHCTFWVQQNGALFQLAWNSTKPGSNCLVENSEVLAWEARCGDPKLNQGGAARTFINLRSSDSNPISTSNTFRNIYVQGQLDRFIGINGKYQGSQSLSYSNTLLENITLEKKPERYSWIYTGNSPFLVSFEFKNVKMAGQCLTSSNYAFNTEGNVLLSYKTCDSSTGNAPPLITLSSPSQSSNFIAPAIINFSATATDADGSIAKVEFFNGTTLLATDLSAPYTFTWSNVAAGTYFLSAKATDNGGAAKTSASSTVTVRLPNQAPEVSLNAIPLNYTAPGLINLSATAADADGSIAKVEFFNGTTLLGTDLSAPYTFTWSNVAAGTYALSAKATDSEGATKTSSGLTVTVRLPNQAPEVSLNAIPLNYTAPVLINLSATATDADGSIAKVEFFNGTTLLGTDLSAPYTFTWSNVAAGTYNLSAKATDNEGAAKTSSPLTVQVSNPIPNDITDLKASSVTCSSVKLSWTDKAGETGYRIRRKLPTETIFTNIADVPANTINYTDATVSAGKTYQYMVRPLVNGTAVALSNVVSANVPRCPVAASVVVQAQVSVLVQPNPFDQQFNFSISDNSEIIQVVLKDNQGISRAIQYLQTGENSYLAYTPLLPVGLYYLQVQTITGVYTTQVMKQ